MGNSSSEALEVRSLLAQNWLPSDREPHVLVHRATHEQVLRHHLRIPAKDLPRESALFSARMNSHQPYICRLLYFHPAPDPRSPHDHEKDSREMVLYTDRFLRLREWSREKVVFALHGLRRLVSVHGPMRISEHMVCQNEYGEVKVWISENAANNHPDFKYTSEEQSMADFAAVLTKRNQELASLLLGCLTLKEAAERLNRPFKEENSIQQSHSHRELAKKRENNDKTLLTPYKNVFGEMAEGVKSKQEIVLTPKASSKNFEVFHPITFHQKEEEFNVQSTNSITLGRCRDFIQPAKSRAPNEQTTPNKSHPKSRLSYEGIAEQGRGVESHYHPSKAEASLEFNKRNATGNRPQQPNKPFIYQPRFQTANNLSSHIGYASMKPKQEMHWVSPAESVNLVSTVSYHNRRDPKPVQTLKDTNKPSEGITIINNNVNNFISNVTHNHIVNSDNKPPQQHTQVHQFRTQSKKEQPPNISPHASNQFFKNGYKGKEKYAMPNFLQQKKKPSSQWMEQPPLLVNKCKSNINLAKKDAVATNPQESPTETPNITSLHLIQDSEVARRQHKVFNFSKNYDPTHSGHKSSTPTFTFNLLGPRTPPPASPQNFSSFQKPFSNFESKVPLRTKTTQFYHKGKDGPKKDELQNKSFTQHELEKSIYEQKEAEEHEKKSAKKEQLEEPVLKQQNTTVQPTPQPPEGESGKLQFKKQLRNEFKFLLGGGQGKEKQEESTRTTLNSKADEGEAKEGNLKEKINRKKVVFAELKKQALKVLTDD